MNSELLTFTPLKQNTIQVIWAFVEIVCIYSEHQMFFTIKLLGVSSQSSFVFFVLWMEFAW